jgi:gliding motility-associated transport system ATP-binding protein
VLVDVSFTVARGQALGLVGPGGAGKSIALRMLAGLVEPTSGRAVVGGHAARTREARRRVGYLAQGAPLDDDARVAPYLRTLCRLRGVAPALHQARIDAALDRCGLGDCRHEVIRRLPADLRRRVGLAQAVVHEPDVLLLDEPGPDAELIAALGRDRAVVLSGDAGADVSAVCGRVLVLEAGRVVADETPDALRARPRLEVLVVVRGDAAAAARHVREVAGVVAVAVEALEGGAHRLTVTGDRDDLQDAIARAIVAHGLGLRQLSSRPAPPAGAG